MEDNLGKTGAFLNTLKPQADIPFDTVIRVFFRTRVLPFTDSIEDKQLLTDLIQAATVAGQKARREGLFASRPNEAGNKIEPFLLNALVQRGLTATVPKTAAGKTQSMGYPDIHLVDRVGRHTYIEVKTNEHTVDVVRSGGLRTFYLSPPKPNKSKIVYDARHLVVGFGLEKISKSGQTCFVPRNWKIVSLHGLKVNLKYEFNTNSKGIYRQDAILADGSVD